MDIICIDKLTLYKKCQKLPWNMIDFDITFSWKGRAQLYKTASVRTLIWIVAGAEKTVQSRHWTWITQTIRWPLRQQHQKHQDIAGNKKEVQADQSWGSNRKVKFMIRRKHFSVNSDDCLFPLCFPEETSFLV